MATLAFYQRGSAQAAAAYYRNRCVDIHLVEPERIQNRIIGLLCYVLDRVRETADWPFLPSLKQADLQFRIDGRV